MDNYISQYGQDRLLDQILFKKKQNGVFVDIGANDGKTISNTYYFEKNLNWTGICFEPLDEAYKKLQANRSSINIHGCAFNKTCTDTFYSISGYGEMLSGLKSQYDDRHLKRIEQTIAEYGGEIKKIEVNCYDINETLIKNNFHKIDFISLDTEGGELNILKAINFDLFKITAIVVENNYNDDSTKKFLYTKGYLLFNKLDCDEIFLHPDHYGRFKTLMAQTELKLTNVYRKCRAVLSKVKR
jgi:FkbM family methyltransferase